MVNVGMIKYLFPRRPFNNDSPKLLVGITPAKKSAIAVEIATIANAIASASAISISATGFAFQ